MSRSLLAALALVAGCSESKKQEPIPPAEQPIVIVPVDAAVGPAPIVTDPSMSVGEPLISAHPQPGRAGKPIDVTLRSSPPGAFVAVDGVNLGTTPAHWNGVADGREHQFVFTLRGHAIAQYRFVPVTSGVIHPRLLPIAEDPDAGVPPPEVVPPPPVAKPIDPYTTPVDAAVPSEPAMPGIGPQP